MDWIEDRVDCLLLQNVFLKENSKICSQLEREYKWIVVKQQCIRERTNINVWGKKINKFVLLGCAEMWNILRELHFNPIIDTKDK